MGRNYDNAPIGNTCPMIDEVISGINSVDWSDNTFHTSDSLGETMEKIRSANLTLRNWGNDECKRANELDNDLDYANRQIKDLEAEVKSLKADIDYYSSQELEKTA